MTTTMIKARDVEIAKGEGKYRFAGQLAALRGDEGWYGCHFGMRSTRERAMEEFRRGYDEVTHHLMHGDRR